MSRFKTIARWLYGLMYVLAGVNHFRSPDFYVRIMPPALPYPRELVYLSGVAEVVLGVLLLIPRTQKLAAWGLIALLIAVFPANIFMAMRPEEFRVMHPGGSTMHLEPWMLYARLPFQAVFIGLAYWFTKTESKKSRATSPPGPLSEAERG